MTPKIEPQAGSYEASLSDSELAELHKLLMSSMTLAEVALEASPWQDGPEKGRQPSKSCLARVRTRLRIEERASHIELATATARATKKLLKKFVDDTDQDFLLEQAITLIGYEIIDGSADLRSRITAARLMLRRADQRQRDRARALEAQASSFQPANPE